METDSVVRIMSWKAEPGYLEVGVWVEPWSRSCFYRREFTNIGASYTSRWIWLDGQKESGIKSHSNEDVAQILDRLVRNHGTLGLFYMEYGIEAAEE
jgi:hypothetical protein